MDLWRKLRLVGTFKLTKEKKKGNKRKYMLRPVPCIFFCSLVWKFPLISKLKCLGRGYAPSNLGRGEVGVFFIYWNRAVTFFPPPCNIYFFISYCSHRYLIPLNSMFCPDWLVVGSSHCTGKLWIIISYKTKKYINIKGENKVIRLGNI